MGFLFKLDSSSISGAAQTGLQVRGGDDVVDFEDHLDDLGGETELADFAGEGLIDALLPHVVGAAIETVDAKVAGLGGGVQGADFGNDANGAETGVLGERRGDDLESVGKGAHGVLLDSVNSFGGVGDGDRGGEFGGSAAGDDAGVSDEIADGADGVVDGALGLVDGHLVAAADEDGDGLWWTY